MDRRKCLDPKGIYKCVVNPTQFSSASAGWKKMAIRTLDKPWSQAGDLTFIGTTFGGPGTPAGTPFVWDFTKLPYLSGPPGIPSVTGILGALVFDADVYKDPKIQPPANVETAFVFNDGGGDIEAVATQESVKIEYHLEPMPVEFQWPCFDKITCPEKISNVLVQPPNAQTGMPAKGFVFDGFDWRLAETDPSVDPGTLAMVPALAGRTQDWIPASEPWARLADRDVTIRGVSVDAQGNPGAVMNVQADGSVLTAPFCTYCDFPPVGRSAVVLAASEGRYFVFGDGEPAVVERRLDAALGTSSFPLGEGKRPQEVLAAAWRMDDRSVYAVDRVAPKTKKASKSWIGKKVVRLLRWKYGASGFETLATFPEPCHVFGRQWLVPGPEGDLVYVGSKVPAKKDTDEQEPLSLLLRLKIDDPTGKPAVAGLRLVEEEVFVRPVVGSLAVQYLTPSGGRYIYRHVPFSDLSPKPKGWLPTFVEP